MKLRRPPDSRRAVRCSDCRAQGARFCPHHGVLVVFIDAAPVTIVSASEERARVTADVVRMKLKGKRFNPPRRSAALQAGG